MVTKIDITNWSDDQISELHQKNFDTSLNWSDKKKLQFIKKVLEEIGEMDTTNEEITIESFDYALQFASEEGWVLK